MTSISDRLRVARDQLFVGRRKQLDRFRRALQADTLPFNVLHVHGPGGVGKTALLQAFARCCRDEDVSAYPIDVRDVEPSPTSFRQALRSTLDAGEEPVSSALDGDSRRSVVLVDAYETISALDDWLRRKFLPDLPENVLFVFAGREEPAPEWRTESGWGALVETVSLRNLERDDGRELLRRRDVPESEYEAILDFTHGHPLALSLVADVMDQREEPAFEPADAPDIIATLLEQFVQKVPGPAHRAALEVASLVPYVTEALLETVLDMPDVHDVFVWLRDLSFVSHGDRGLVLHDLARDALTSDLRWRNPEWHDELHERARRFYASQLKDASRGDVRRILSDLTFVLREHPLIEPFFKRLRSQWGEAAGLLEDEFEHRDEAAVATMVENHEGREATDHLETWVQHEAAEVHVYREAAGSVAGFMLTLGLHRLSEEELARDPMTRSASAYLEAHAPLRAGERVSLFRFWMAREGYQEVSPVQSLIFIRQVRHYLTTAGLAYSILPCRDPDRWDRLFTYAGMKRLEDADVELGNHTYALYGHDWRTQPPGDWLDALADRGFSTAPEPSPRDHDRMIVLSRADFEDAVKEAFKEMNRPDRLDENPLLFSRVVTDAVDGDAGEPARIEVLQTLLAETTEELSKDPRDEKYYRAVHRTYVQPAPTQEKAAEQLGVPFSTFRRHLNRGVERVTDILWDAEVSSG